MRSRVLAVVGAMVVVLAGCVSQEDPPLKGDCATTVRFHGVVYRPWGTEQTPRSGRPLGSSVYYGCAGKPIPGDTRTVRLHVVVGLDPDAAILVREKDGQDSVYVPQGTRRRDLPAKLTEAMGYARCRVPASFTGTLRGVTPWPEDYDIAVPYAARFEAHHGSGLQLDQWSTVTLEAKITTATQPVPTPSS